MPEHLAFATFSPAPRYRSDHEITLLITGQDYFPALLRAIQEADRDIRLETYIFRDDAVGASIVNALNHASARGVDVQLVVDGFGSATTIAWLRAQLQGPALQIFRPETQIWKLSTRRLRRLHRKLVVIDGELAFVGGINILDDFDDPNHGRLEHPRYDFAVQVQGPLVQNVQSASRSLWLQLAMLQAPLSLRTRRLMRDQWQHHWRDHHRRKGHLRAVGNLTGGDPMPHIQHHPFTEVTAAFAVRDNFRHRRSIEHEYLRQIQASTAQIIIANAYFLPGQHLRWALIDAATRGVKVKLLLQGKVEYRLQHYATQAMYGELLAAGIEIFEYQRSFLHAKVAVIDDWATVGSSNIDPFSLLLAREANVFIRDQDFARHLRQQLENTCLQDTTRIEAPGLMAQAWHAKLKRRLARWALRLALALTGGQGY